MKITQGEIYLCMYINKQVVILKALQNRGVTSLHNTLYCKILYNSSHIQSVPYKCTYYLPNTEKISKLPIDEKDIDEFIAGMLL